VRNHRWLGRLSYYLLWPGIAIYLLGSQRSRIVVVSGDYILVVKGWLSDGKWSLPGGGIHGSESILNGALRELHEETSLEIKTKDINELLSEKFWLHGVRLKLHYFSVILPTKLLVQKQRGEITDIEWINLSKLDSNNTAKDALRAIAIWKST
jgi:8-oxo-dGTP pyrophosphatase MutT (NUDIX family)